MMALGTTGDATLLFDLVLLVAVIAFLVAMHQRSTRARRR